MKRAVVVGAGLSGLAAAHALTTRDVDVTVLEAGPRPGGHLATTRREGWLVEHTASSFPAHATELRDLCRAVDVPLVEAPAATTRLRHVVHRRRPRPLPVHPLQLLTTRLLSWGAKARVLREGRVPPLGADEEESVDAFFTRRLGPGVRHLVDAFVTGVYAGDPARLSLPHAFPDLRRMEREHGSLRAGMRARRGGGRGLLAPRDGFGALVDALATRVDPVCGKPVKAVRPAGGGGFAVEAGGETLDADAVVLAVPPPQAAALVGDEAFRAAAEAVPVAPVTVVALGWPRSDFRGRGLGVLAPEGENRTILGALFESNAFPGRAPRGHVLVRALVGGARHPDRARLPSAALAEAVTADLSLLGIARGTPALTQVEGPGFIPQPVLGHGGLLREAARLQAAHPKLALLGAGYDTGAVARLAGAAEAAAERISKDL